MFLKQSNTLHKIRKASASMFSFSMVPPTGLPAHPVERRLAESRIDRLIPDLFNYDWMALDTTVDRFLNLFQENESSWEVHLDVPGFNKDNIKIVLDKDVLKITGETKTRNYSRTIQLPRKLEYKSIESTCKDGVLSVYIYKTENTLPKQIKVTDG